MPFTFKVIRMPLLRIMPSGKGKTGRVWVWHAGSWQYNARTGQHTLKLPGTVRYQTRTRAQKRAARMNRARRRQEARAGWEKYFTGQAPAPVAAPKTPRTTAKRATQKKVTAKSGPAKDGATGTTRQDAARTARRPVRKAAAPADFTGHAAPGMPSGNQAPVAARKPVKKDDQTGASSAPTGKVFSASGNDRIAMQVGHISHGNQGPGKPSGPTPPPAPPHGGSGGSGSGQPVFHNGDNVTIGAQADLINGPLTVYMDQSHSGGLCGQATRDGTPCQRQGTCPPGTHTTRTARTARKKPAKRKAR